jgi:hypothetical protein
VHQDHRVGVQRAVRHTAVEQRQHLVRQRVALRVGAAVHADQQDVHRAVERLAGHARALLGDRGGDDVRGGHALVDVAEVVPAVPRDDEHSRRQEREE